MTFFARVRRAGPRLLAAAAPRRLVVVTAVAAAALAVAVAAAAAPSWYDGAKVTSQLQNACLGNVEFGALTYVGYHVDKSALPPPGHVFYGHVVFGAATTVGGGGCGTTDQGAEVDLVLPRRVSLAVSRSNPIRCFHEDTGAAEVRNETCPTHAIAGTYGPALPPRDGGGAWDLPVGRLFEVQFPLVSSRQLRGPAGGNCPEALDELQQRSDCLVAAVHVADGDTDPWLLPSEDLITGAGSPAAGSLVARLARANGQTVTSALRARALLVSCSLNAAGRCAVSAAIPAAVPRRLHVRVPPGAKTVTLGTGSATLRAAGRRTVRVRLSASGLAALRHASRLTVTFVLAASGGGEKRAARIVQTLAR